MKNKNKSKKSETTTLDYFKMLGSDVRNEIANYLSEKDLKSLNCVAKAFHGPVLFDPHYRDTRAKHTFNKIMAPTRLFAKEIKKEIINGPYGGPSRASSPFGLFAFPFFAGASSVVAGIAKPIAYLSGAIKDKRLKKQGKTFTGKKITFKK
jgi:hypothetical protein